jgi:hypothetical protein
MSASERIVVMNLDLLGLALPKLLDFLGITGDDAVAIIDSLKARQAVLGYVREKKPDELWYRCIATTPSGGISKFILSVDNAGFVKAFTTERGSPAP